MKFVLKAFIVMASVFTHQFLFFQGAQAGPYVQVSQQSQALFDLFGGVPDVPASDRAPHTFVFFVQGAQQHSVPPTQAKHQDPKAFGYADREYMNRISHLAQVCKSCNVIVLHTQSIGAKWWWINKENFQTTLDIYARGNRVFKKAVDLVNGADPKLVIALLGLAYDHFPVSGIHFIYVGHGFYPGYVPVPESEPMARQRNLMTAFDMNFLESAYNIDLFASAFPSARVAAVTRMGHRLGEKLKKYQDSDYHINPMWENLRKKLVGYAKDSVRPVKGEPDIEEVAVLRGLLPRAYQHLNLLEIEDLVRDLKAMRTVATSPIASITLAACSMEHPVVRKALWPHAYRVNASSTVVFEALNQGFVFSFLDEVREVDSESEVAERIDQTIFEYSDEEMKERKEKQLLERAKSRNAIDDFSYLPSKQVG